MRGILLSGGLGSRLFPLTIGNSKQLLPVYNKPMIYYSLSLLMLGGIKDIAIITNPDNILRYKQLLNQIEYLGLKFTFIKQDKPDGIPQSFILGEQFIGDSDIVLVLGDNMLHGPRLRERLTRMYSSPEGCSILGFEVQNPQDFGVAVIDINGKVTELVEKPVDPPSNFAIPGLYKFPNCVVNKAKSLKKSVRNETEIIDLLKLYFNENKISIDLLGRGYSWFDCGSIRSLNYASDFVRLTESNYGFMIGSPEEIAINKKWVSSKQVLQKIQPLNSEYYQNLKRMINESTL